MKPPGCRRERLRLEFESSSSVGPSAFGILRPFQVTLEPLLYQFDGGISGHLGQPLPLA